MEIVSHNLLAMNASRQLNITTTNQKKTTEKLSSGYKINRAADDAAGLAVSERMRRVIRGLDRGVDNTREGIGLCQVADGALAEVHDMLHRLTEMSVQAANGTNSESDRESIQDEVNEILTEIDRIGETTTFNGVQVFQGKEGFIYDYSDLEYQMRQLPYSDWSLSTVDLRRSPFSYMNSSQSTENINAIKNFNVLNLSAVTNASSTIPGQEWPLVYGAGASTSHSSFRLSYSISGNEQPKKVINNNNLAYIADSYKTIDNGWERKFRYLDATTGIDLTITQDVLLEPRYQTANEKYYTVKYSVENNSDYSNGLSELNVDFMFHLDTSYDGTHSGDLRERYYMNGTMVEKKAVYEKTEGGAFNPQNAVSEDIHSTVPNSFTIVDPEGSASFTEKIILDSDDYSNPSALSIGQYSRIWDWYYYNDLLVNNKVGSNAVGQDLGFSLLYNKTFDNNTSSSEVFGFRYGICSKDYDQNITGVDVVSGLPKKIDHVFDKTLWIQSGNETMDGIILKVGAMNTKILGIHDLNVTTEMKATESLDQIDGAVAKISAQRARIGAQQNRLEHTVDNESNIVENTTASESRIRDTDMAKEMVAHSRNNILQQAGHSMLAQANNSKERVLQILG